MGQSTRDLDYEVEEESEVEIDELDNDSDSDDSCKPKFMKCSKVDSNHFYSSTSYSDWFTTSVKAPRILDPFCCSLS